MSTSTLIPTNQFSLEAQFDKPSQLRNLANGAVFPVPATSLRAQYSFGEHYLVILHDFSSLDESAVIYFLSPTTVLDSAKTVEIGLWGDMDDIEILQSDTLRFSYPNHISWRLRCHTRPRFCLHVSTPYMLWMYRHTFQSWFTLKREK
ncbi:hypothetical protein ACJJIF_04555 [Microbulbifer sp. SSSA002]|uniref:hypothetical protein n=1 Tax=Microbulbifer sp. SSSA002 TaxID=3243376 RepID=UPI0040396726